MLTRKVKSLFIFLSFFAGLEFLYFGFLFVLSSINKKTIYAPVVKTIYFVTAASSLDRLARHSSQISLPDL